MSNFQTWWDTEGSAMRPQENEALEEFAKRVTGIAWSNGEFCAIEARKAFDWAAALAEQPAQQEPMVTVLPDGSAFSVVSFSLPHDHWLYAPYQYMPGHYDPVELPSPVVTHADRDRVVAAIRYAVRGATMCGKEPDFDPDALVQNATYALCGPFNAAPQASTATSVDVRLTQPVREWVEIEEVKWDGDRLITTLKEKNT